MKCWEKQALLTAVAPDWCMSAVQHHCLDESKLDCDGSGFVSPVGTIAKVRMRIG